MNEELTNIVLSLSSLGNKRIESLSKKVLKKMSFKSSKDLENTNYIKKCEKKVKISEDGLF